MFVKPREGLMVRHPVTKRHIPEDGIEVSETDAFWVRRLRSGDVVQCQPPQVKE